MCGVTVCVVMRYPETIGGGGGIGGTPAPGGGPRSRGVGRRAACRAGRDDQRAEAPDGRGQPHQARDDRDQREARRMPKPARNASIDASARDQRLPSAYAPTV